MVHKNGLSSNDLKTVFAVKFLLNTYLLMFIYLIYFLKVGSKCFQTAIRVHSVQRGHVAFITCSFYLLTVMIADDSLTPSLEIGDL